MERVVYGEDGRILNFNVPTQLRYLDTDADEDGVWVGGIGYGAHIICGCCGGLIDIDEIYDSAPSTEKKPIWVYSWMDISEVIMNDE